MSENRRRIEAILNGQSDFGAHGSADHHKRYAQKIEGQSRRRCGCGCGNKETHVGMANGVALTSGCEWHVYRWIDEPGYQTR